MLLVFEHKSRHHGLDTALGRRGLGCIPPEESDKSGHVINVASVYLESQVLTPC